MIEVLVIVVVVAGMAAILLPMLAGLRQRKSRIDCATALKMVGTGFRLFATDNDGIFPLGILSNPTNGLNTAHLGGWSQDPTNLWKLFQLAENDLSGPRILVCPNDPARSPAGDFFPAWGTNYSSGSFAHPSNRNLALSYFLGLNSELSLPTMILAGDRNLDRDPNRTDQNPGRNYLKGEQRLGSTQAEVKDLRWNDDIHQRFGNVAFMDGSVQQLTRAKLRDALMNSGDKTNRIWLPQ